MMSADLLRDIGHRLLHEVGELRGVIDTDQRVEVIAHDSDGKDSDSRQVLRAAYDAKDQLVCGRVRPQ